MISIKAWIIKNYLVDTNTEPKCVVGGNIQEILQDDYALLQTTVEEKMKQISLGTVLHQLATIEVQKKRGNQDIVAKFL